MRSFRSLPLLWLLPLALVFGCLDESGTNDASDSCESFCEELQECPDFGSEDDCDDICDEVDDLEDEVSSLRFVRCDNGAERARSFLSSRLLLFHSPLSHICHESISQSCLSMIIIARIQNRSATGHMIETFEVVELSHVLK